MDWEYIARCQHDDYLPGSNEPFECGAPAVIRVYFDGGGEMNVCLKHFCEMAAIEELPAKDRAMVYQDVLGERDAD